MAEFFEKMPMILPAILLGAAIPLAVILVLALTPARKRAHFPMILFGFVSFFASLVLVGIVLLFASQSLLATVKVSPADGDQVVMVGGCIVLLAFYLITEVLRYFSYNAALKQEEKNAFGGLLFGSGFVLAQDLLILGLVSNEEFTFGQGMAFGVLMLICGVIYLLISEIAYRTAQEGHRFIGSALAAVYFLLLGIMLVFASVVVTYIFVGVALAFSLLMGYLLLPNKKKEGAL